MYIQNIVKYNMTDNVSNILYQKNIFSRNKKVLQHSK